MKQQLTHSNRYISFTTLPLNLAKRLQSRLVASVKPGANQNDYTPALNEVFYNCIPQYKRFKVYTLIFA